MSGDETPTPVRRAPPAVRELAVGRGTPTLWLSLADIADESRRMIDRIRTGLADETKIQLAHVAERCRRWAKDPPSEKDRRETVQEVADLHKLVLALLAESR